MTIRNHIDRTGKIEAVLNSTPQLFERIEFSNASIDGGDSEKLNVNVTGGNITGGVVTPTNQTPTNGTINVSLTPTLTGSTYLSVMGLTQYSVEVEVYESTDLVTPVYTGSTIGATTSHTVSVPLSNALEYHWRIRYKEVDGAYSAWSTLTTFNTVLGISVNTPVVVSPNLVSDIIENPMLVSNAFSTSSGSDTHQISQWQITNVQGNYNAPVWDSGWNYTNLTSITVDFGYLQPNTTYYWRVRHKGTTYGWSDWSSEGSFITLAEFDYRPMLALVCNTNTTYNNLIVINQNGDIFDNTMILDNNLLSGIGYCTGFSPDGNYLAFGVGNATGLVIYKRSGYKFQIRCTINNIGYNGSVGIGKVMFSPNGNYLACIARGTVANSAIQIFKRTGDVFDRIYIGSYLSGTEKVGLDWTSDSTYVACRTETASSLQLYKVVGDTVTDLTDNIDVQVASSDTVPYGNRCLWSPDGTVLAVGSSTAPFVHFYNRSGDNLTKVPDVNVDSGVSLTRAISWHPTLPYIFVANSGTGTNMIRTYERQAGDQYRLVTTLGVGGDYGTVMTAIRFSVDGTYFVMSNNIAPLLRIFKWNNSLSTYQELSSPSIQTLTIYANDMSFC
jgi:hypothetical protein